MFLFFFTILFACVLSVSASIFADATLTERVPLIGNKIGLVLSHNPGIAFGLRLPPVLQELLILAALVAVCILAVRTVHDHTRNSALALQASGIRLVAIGYGLIVGGALGNIIDRIADGFVTDFFQVGSFPVFNLADSCITIGVAFVLAEMIRVSHRHHHTR